MSTAWIEFIAKYDQWKIGDKSKQARTKCQGYVDRGLAEWCDAPAPAKPASEPAEVETATAEAPQDAETAEQTPRPVRRRRRGRPKNGETDNDN